LYLMTQVFCCAIIHPKAKEFKEEFQDGDWEAEDGDQGGEGGGSLTRALTWLYQDLVFYSRKFEQLRHKT
jgi:hypothetical protein